jgi:hypothetical protein
MSSATGVRTLSTKGRDLPLPVRVHRRETAFAWLVHDVVLL